VPDAGWAIQSIEPPHDQRVCRPELIHHLLNAGRASRTPDAVSVQIR
jgi:hypothetical protein